MKSGHILQKLFITLGIVILAACLSYFDVMGVWDKTISDMLNQKTSDIDKDIFIIGIDDKTLEEYGMITMWGRKLSGDLVKKLNENENFKPAVIGLDIIYSEEVDEEGDKYFAQVCKESGNVVTVSSFSLKGQPETDSKGNTFYNPYHVKYVVEPYEKLKDSVNVGFANTAVDSDGFVRQAMAYIEYNGQKNYSFPMQVYRQYMQSTGEEPRDIKTYGRGNKYYFSYSGKPGDYTVISMADVMEGKVDTRIFKDSIVLVGAYAVGMQDAYKPAIAHNIEMYGVEIHANIIQALMEGKTQLPFSKTLAAILTGLLCGAFFLFTDKLKILWSTVGFAVLTAGNFILVKVLYHSGYILPVLLIPVALFVIWAVTLITGYITELKRRRHVLNVFKQYVAPQVVEKVIRNKNYKIILGGETRHVAVLFVDIRGFTTISETMKPENVVEFLNGYLSLTTKSIFDYNGTLDKFIGDATMAVFNAPFDLEDYIFKAVCAAWDMKQNADKIADVFKEHFGTEVSFGIGINCGNAVVGNVGCDFRMDYTTIGDTVNTAARLESRAEPGQILISEYVYEAVKDRIEATPVGEIALKGKNHEIFVYQLDNVKKEVR